MDVVPVPHGSKFKYFRKQQKLTAIDYISNFPLQWQPNDKTLIKKEHPSLRPYCSHTERKPYIRKYAYFNEHDHVSFHLRSVLKEGFNCSEMEK
jgi:hypothetical protein